jgi:hypothetical protein
MKRYIIFIGIVAALCSCDDIYDNINEMTDSEIIYPVGYNQSDVKAFQGDQRVEIDLNGGNRVSAAEMARRLSKAKRTVVEYGDTIIRFDSVYSWVNIPNLIVPNSILFKIYTENAWGDRSLPVEVRQKPFTDEDKGALVVLTSSVATSTKGIVIIAPAAGSYTLNGVKYSYTDNGGNKQDGQTTANNFMVNDLKPGTNNPIRISCNVLPNETLDALWIDTIVDVKTITQDADAFDTYFSLTTPFPLGSHHFLSAGAPCEFNAADFDIGGEGLSYHKQSSNRYGNREYRPNGGDTGGNEVNIWNDVPSLMGVAWVSNGDWVAYTLEVQDPGDYKIEAKHTGGSDHSVFCIIDFANYWSTFTFPNVGWGNSAYRNLGVVNFSAGRHKMTWTFYGNSGLMGLRFTKVD